MGAGRIADVLASRRMLLALPLLLCSLSCGGEGVADPRPRLVLLYATCTLNADYLSPYDDAVDFTPSLQRLADEGLVFERHTTEAGQSGIAFASIFSGSQADHHQMYRHPLELSPDVHLVSEAFADAGYETFIWNTHSQASPKLGYAQGIPKQNQHKGLIDASEGPFPAILERLAADPGYRAFVMTNFTLTHAPYKRAALDEFLDQYPSRERDLSRLRIKKLHGLYGEERIGLSYNHEETVSKLQITPDRLRDLRRAIGVVYASTVHTLDRHFGGVMEAIREAGLLDDSLVVFTADHGEVVERDNALYPFSHAMQLAPEVLRVPLIVRAPRQGVPRGRYEPVTRSIDVFPTMAGLSSIELGDRPGISGVDLTRAIRGTAARPDLIAGSHTSVLVRSVYKGMQNPYASRNWRALQRNTPDEDVRRIWARLRDGDMVYKRRRIGDGEWQHSAFDLARDPDERVDLFDPADPAHRSMAEQLDAYWQNLVDSYAHERASGRLLPVEEEEEALRALGYIE